MLRFLLFCFGVLGPLSLLLVGCTPPPNFSFTPTPQPGLDPTLCQDVVKQMTQLIREQEIPDHLLQPEGAPQAGNFDPNRYFDIFEHIHMEPGYMLDYVYFKTLMGAEPILYARKIDDAPFVSPNEFYDGTGSNGEKDLYLEHVYTDGSAQGFLEYVILAIHAEQFYLYWHAHYNDLQVVCTTDAVNELIDEVSDGSFGAEFSSSQRKQAQHINYFPRVDYYDDAVDVRIVTFTKWGGLEEKIFRITKDPPHKILDVRSHILLYYDCGINF